MPLATIDRTVLFFAHIPKTGGTSVESYLRAKGRVALLSLATDWSRTSPQHMLYSTARHYIPPESYHHSFAVLRDPMARLKSEFRMGAALLDGGAPAHPLFRLLALRRHLTRADLYRVRVANRRTLPLSFDEWVRLNLRLCRRSPYYTDSHFAPQVDFLPPGCRLFLLEQGLEPVYRWIDTVTGTGPAALAPHDNKGLKVTLQAAPGTEALVRDFYRADYDLIARIAAGETDVWSGDVRREGQA